MEVRRHSSVEGPVCWSAASGCEWAGSGVKHASCAEQKMQGVCTCCVCVCASVFLWVFIKGW